MDVWKIDLVRNGLRLPMREPLPPADYDVIASRAPERPLAQVWFFTIRS